MSSLLLLRRCVVIKSLKKSLIELSQIPKLFIMSRITLDPRERVEKILKCDEDIEQKIMALRCEVSDVEAKVLDEFIIHRLEKENQDLEEDIDTYKRELALLEKLNGRRQIDFGASSVLKVQQSNTTVLSDASGSGSNEKSLSPSADNEVAPSPVSKKLKKETKKVENSDKKKNEKVDAKKSGGNEELPVDIGRLDLKVGKILQIEKHPDADSLYVEKVDIGKPEPITVVSGLVKHISESDMLNSLVIILCNLKPAKMRGVTSEGMVMCASSEGVVEVLRPPSDAVPGDIVTCPGYNSNPDSILNPKKKIFETVAPDLITDNEMIATYKNTRWSVANKGPVKAQTLKGANIK